MKPSKRFQNQKLSRINHSTSIASKNENKPINHFKNETSPKPGKHFRNNRDSQTLPRKRRLILGRRTLANRTPVLRATGQPTSALISEATFPIENVRVSSHPPSTPKTLIYGRGGEILRALCIRIAQNTTGLLKAWGALSIYCYFF